MIVENEKKIYHKKNFLQISERSTETMNLILTSLEDNLYYLNTSKISNEKIKISLLHRENKSSYSIIKDNINFIYPKTDDEIQIDLAKELEKLKYNQNYKVLTHNLDRVELIFNINSYEFKFNLQHDDSAQNSFIEDLSFNSWHQFISTIKELKSTLSLQIELNNKLENTIKEKDKKIEALEKIKVCDCRTSQINQDSVTNENKIELLRNYSVESYLNEYENRASVEDLKIIIENKEKSNINFLDLVLGRNAIILASKFKASLSVIKYLVDEGVDYHKLNKENTSILHYVIRFNTFDYVQYILDLGLKTNIPKSSPGSDGYTPLHYAFLYNNIYVLKIVFDSFLNENGNNFDFNKYLTKEHGSTILHLSVINNGRTKEEILKVIEFAITKVDINLKDKNDNTALHHACTIKFNSYLEVIDLLIKNGADKNLKNKSNQRPFDLLNKS